MTKTLDGNGVAMTHYCAGNRPKAGKYMGRADGNRLEFRSVSVGDLKGSATTGEHSRDHRRGPYGAAH
jgi:hypothetical protein